MEYSELMKKRRTIRKYKQQPVSDEDLRKLIDAARVAASGGNQQQLRYIVIRTPEMVEKIFKLTAWGMFVKPKRQPVWGKDAPAAFIMVVGPKGAPNHIHGDAGAAIMSMQYRAVELGLGTCWLGAFKREKAAEAAKVPVDYEPHYLLAVGHPDEEPVQENIELTGSNKYYLDDNDRLHVPKYTVDALTVWC